jgi:ergothioneine biosynthesis protein EgtB
MSSVVQAAVSPGASLNIEASIPMQGNVPADSRQAVLAARVGDTRRATLALLSGLSPEDCQVQSMPDASPMKWHLGHVGWFFETFVLEPNLPGFRSLYPDFRELFNSYYVGIGPRTPRAQRGLLSRPSFVEVERYQADVLDRVLAMMRETPLSETLLDTIELGINHEQQHQELILTDLKHHFWCNQTLPVYRPQVSRIAAAWPAGGVPYRYDAHPEGLRVLGHGDSDFAFDNERPAHRVWLDAFELGTRPVLNGEYLAFMRDGGYARPEFWLAEGWDTRTREDWRAPLYWRDIDSASPRYFTLSGLRELNLFEPVCHISYFEADAYARWAGARLPTEAEWEAAALSRPADAMDVPGFAEASHFHPEPVAPDGEGHAGGAVWEWTLSAYLPYAGFAQAEGAVGEYNGKFMVNQMVLRGGSCATPRSHYRPSYRNFFPTAARWQFSGLRLARGL